MNDTAPWAEARMRELFAQRTPGERVEMACRSFTAARALVLAGIRREYPGISPEELRFQILERTYRADFEPAAWARLLQLWKRTQH
jgi:hypothetical protein